MRIGSITGVFFAPSNEVSGSLRHHEGFFPKPENDPSASTTDPSACRPVLNFFRSPTSLSDIIEIPCDLDPAHLERTINLIRHAMEQIGNSAHNHILSAAYDINSGRLLLSNAHETSHERIGLEFIDPRKRPPYSNNLSEEEKRNLWAGIGFASFVKKDDQLIAFKLDTIACSDSPAIRDRLRNFFGSYWIDNKETLRALFTLPNTLR
ncbi:MAG: hypothetical protein IPJ69_13960 [Deltaproteobacteria bacterium]|nr:MAG: hypothetical protein IPJ69_13960 [Deltaproteobacteria bacterium]